MSEEEITNIIENFLNYKQEKYLSGIEICAISNLLDLYNKEKEKNSILQNKIEAKEQVHEYDMKMIDELKGEVVKLDKELQQEKEKNKEYKKRLIYTENKSFNRKQYYKENYISKDKIKEKIKYYENTINYDMPETMISEYNHIIDILQELLEE